MHQTIIFDLGKVIVPFDFARGYQAIAQYSLYPAEEIPKRIAATDLVHRFECGQVEPRDFVTRLCAQIGARIDYERFCEIWSSIFLPETLVSETLVEGLHRRYRLLLLSNTNAIHFEMVRRNYPLLRHFDEYVLSHEVGALKPSPVMYQAAIARAGCAPHDIFFTDDIADYVAAARHAGIDAVQFQNAGQLTDELRRRGITWE